MVLGRHRTRGSECLLVVVVLSLSSAVRDNYRSLELSRDLLHGSRHIYTGVLCFFASSLYV